MEKSINIYADSRRRAGFTQEHAAELLAVSCRCLCDYETGVRPVPNQIVGLMTLVYRDDLLAMRHLRLEVPTAQESIPDVRPGLPFAQVVCRLVRLMNDFVEKNDEDATLMLIAEDGKVDEDQVEDWKRIETHLKEIVDAALEVRYSDRSGL